jgi:hypothetical protein
VTLEQRSVATVQPNLLRVQARLLVPLVALVRTPSGRLTARPRSARQTRPLVRRRGGRVPSDRESRRAVGSLWSRGAL